VLAFIVVMIVLAVTHLSYGEWGCKDRQCKRCHQKEYAHVHLGSRDVRVADRKPLAEVYELDN
jgi:hypothetical protein